MPLADTLHDPLRRLTSAIADARTGPEEGARLILALLLVVLEEAAHATPDLVDWVEHLLSADPERLRQHAADAEQRGHHRRAAALTARAERVEARQ